MCSPVCDVGLLDAHLFGMGTHWSSLCYRCAQLVGTQCANDGYVCECCVDEYYV